MVDDPISKERLKREMEALYKACCKGGPENEIIFFPPGTYEFDRGYDIRMFSTPWHGDDARMYLTTSAVDRWEPKPAVVLGRLEA